MNQKTIFEGFAFDSSQYPPVYCQQRMIVVGDHLVHDIDGKERAWVPVEHAPAYVSTNWVADIGRDNENLIALRKMHISPGAEITKALTSKITGSKHK